MAGVDQRFFAGRFVAGAFVGFGFAFGAVGFFGLALDFGAGFDAAFVGFALTAEAGTLAVGFGVAGLASLSAATGAAGAAWTSGGRPVVPRR